MNSRLRAWVAGALVAICCVSAVYGKSKIKPVMEPAAELVATHGFIVGTFAGGNGKATENFGDTEEFRVFIDGEDLRTGTTFMVAVTPGEHVLHKVTASVVKDDYVINKKVRTTLSYPLERRFTVEAGKVTTLGALFLYEKDAAPDDLAAKNATGQYMVVAADNGKFLSEFIERQYPQILSSLADKTLHPANTFLNDKQYQALHTVMARARLREIFKGGTRFEPNMRYLVYGALGMAGHLYTDGQGIPVRYRSFELDTFEKVQDCDADAKRHVCVTRTQWRWNYYERRAFLGADGKAERLSLPDGASPINAHLFGTDGVIVGDYDYRMYVRTKSQDPWQVVQQDGVKAGAFVARYVFANAPAGVYTYYEGNEHALTLTDVNDGTTRPVALPPKFKGGAHMVVTPQHLIIGPEWNLLAASQVYMRDNQSGEWSMTKLPTGRCNWMGLDVKDKSRLLATCGFSPGTLYVSRDDGATWNATNEP